MILLGDGGTRSRVACTGPFSTVQWVRLEPVTSRSRVRRSNVSLSVNRKKFTETRCCRESTREQFPRMPPPAEWHPSGRPSADSVLERFQTTPRYRTAPSSGWWRSPSFLVETDPESDDRLDEQSPTTSVTAAHILITWDHYANSAFHLSGVGKRVVIHEYREWRPLYHRLHLLP